MPPQISSIQQVVKTIKHTADGYRNSWMILIHQTLGISFKKMI